jgi:DNA polymerase III delta subunit
VVVAGDPLQAEEAVLEWLPSDVPVTRRSGDELSAALLFSDLGEQGFFAETRALLYTDILSARLSKKDSERLTALLGRLPAETWLACIQVIKEDSKSKADTRIKSAAMRQFSDHSRLLDIRNHAEGQAATRWLVERASTRYELRLSPPQAGRILSASDHSPSQADAELQKLSLLRDIKAGMWVVPEAVLESLLSRSPTARFYDVVDQLLQQPQFAQANLHNWFDSDPEVFHLISEVKRRLLQVRSLRRGEAIYPPFAARSAQSLSRRLSGSRLNQAFEALAKLEHGLKSGAFPAESSRQSELIALQLFAAELTHVMRS